MLWDERMFCIPAKNYDLLNKHIKWGLFEEAGSLFSI